MKLDTRKFKQARLAMGVSQAKIANMLEVTANNVYNWEKGQQPFPYRLKKIIEVMGEDVVIREDED